MRDDDPVSHHDHPDFERGYWAVARHADVQRVSRDSTTFRNAPHPFLEERGQDQSATAGLLITLDAPEHVKLRKLINRGFTPRRVSDLTDALEARGTASSTRCGPRLSATWSRDIALWLPLHVIADLVGVPEEDREHVFELTEQTFGFDASVTLEERAQAAMEMYAYADGLCELRRNEPHDDLISVLLESEVDGERLAQMQIDLFFMLLQNAGSETTRNLITTGTARAARSTRSSSTAARRPVAAPGRDRGAAALRDTGDPVHPHGRRRHRGRRPARSPTATGW